MHTPIVSIILINYNTFSYTEQCIKSIRENTSIEYEVIIVENNSDDRDIIRELENRYDFTKVIISDFNLGFGAGNNLGVYHASGKYIVILNNDTIVYPQTMDTTKKILDESNNKCVITGFIEGPNGELQHSGGRELRIIIELLNFGLFLIKHIPNKYTDNQYFIPTKHTGSTNIDWASGCFFAMHKDFYNLLGGFDEEMFMYVEDVEFHKRIRLHGGKILFHPRMKIRHFGSQSAKNYKLKVLVSHYRNTLYYFKKHSTKFSFVMFYLISKGLFFVWFLFFNILEVLTLRYNSKCIEKKNIYKNLFFK